MFHVCLYYNTVLSVPCILVITCFERTDLLALLCVMFPCVYVTFPYSVSGQMWYLIVSIPDLCLLLYSGNTHVPQTETTGQLKPKTSKIV